MNANRKYWNEQEKLLQKALVRSQDHQRAIALFLSQHAMTHSKQMCAARLWSFADEVLEGMNAPALRAIPPNGEHSFIWVFWHLARIEDITMNLLVAGRPQVFNDDGWARQLGTTVIHSGNAMDTDAVAALSAAVNIDALWEYRSAVGRRTREVVIHLKPAQLKQRVSDERLQSVRAARAIPSEAPEILAYWGKRTIAGLLLMPPTRHNFLHLNEALRIKQKVLQRV